MCTNTQFSKPLFEIFESKSGIQIRHLKFWSINFLVYKIYVYRFWLYKF